MLTLIVADGNEVGVVQQDVGSLKRRVGEQRARDELASVALVLELGHAAEFAETHGGFHQPAELGMLGYLALDEQDAALRVEARRHE